METKCVSCVVITGFKHPRRRHFLCNYRREILKSKYFHSLQIFAKPEKADANLSLPFICPFLFHNIRAAVWGSLTSHSISVFLGPVHGLTSNICCTVMKRLGHFALVVCLSEGDFLLSILMGSPLQTVGMNHDR
jgi:hypothetical protein